MSQPVIQTTNAQPLCSLASFCASQLYILLKSHQATPTLPDHHGKQKSRHSMYRGDR